MHISKVQNKSANVKKSPYIDRTCLSLLHEDNFHLFSLLLPESLEVNTKYKSFNVKKPKLVIEVINNFKYTQEIAFYYQFEFGKSEKMVMKRYFDAQVAEVVYCTDLQQFIRLLGPKISPKIHKQTRGMLNTFLNKWLHHLLNNGYRHDRWKLNASSR